MTELIYQYRQVLGQGLRSGRTLAQKARRAESSHSRRRMVWRTSSSSGIPTPSRSPGQDQSSGFRARGQGKGSASGAPSPAQASLRPAILLISIRVQGQSSESSRSGSRSDASAPAPASLHTTAFLMRSGFKFYFWQSRGQAHRFQFRHLNAQLLSWSGSGFRVRVQGPLNKRFAGVRWPRSSMIPVCHPKP